MSSAKRMTRSSWKPARTGTSGGTSPPARSAARAGSAGKNCCGASSRSSRKTSSSTSPRSDAHAARSGLRQLRWATGAHPPRPRDACSARPQQGGRARLLLTTLEAGNRDAGNRVGAARSGGSAAALDLFGVTAPRAGRWSDSARRRLDDPSGGAGTTLDIAVTDAVARGADTTGVGGASASGALARERSANPPASTTNEAIAPNAGHPAHPCRSLRRRRGRRDRHCPRRRH